MNSELLKLALSQQTDGTQQQLRPTQRAQVHESAILKLKGLPYDTTKEQVLDFFQGFDVKTVEFVYEPDGRPSGLAFAEFLTRDEAIRAMAKNGEFIGDRYVKLLLVPRQEMEEQVRLGTIAIPGGAARARAGLLRRRGGRMPMHSGLGPVPPMPGTVDMMLNVMPTGTALMSPHPYSQPHASFSPTLAGRDVYGADNYMYLQHLAHMAPHVPKAMHPHPQAMHPQAHAHAQALQMQSPLMAPQTQHLAMQPHLQPAMRHMAMSPQLPPHHAHQALHASQMVPGPIAPPPGQLYAQGPPPGALLHHHHHHAAAGPVISPAPPSPSPQHHHHHHHHAAAAAAAPSPAAPPSDPQPPTAQGSFASSSGAIASGAGAAPLSASTSGGPPASTADVKTLKGRLAGAR